MAKTALITGASSGIGMAMAEILAKEGWDLAIVGRSGDALEALRDRLNALNGGNILILVKDLSENDSARQIFCEVDDAELQVDMLINCAGFGDFGLFADSDPDKMADMIRVNDVSLTVLTRLFLPQMIGRKAGIVLNVASVAAFQPGPLMAVYYASKAYVLSFTESLSTELKGTGVKVSALCPGPTDTGFAAAARALGTNVFKRSTAADAYAVARFGLRKAEKGKTVAVYGTVFKVSLWFERLLPRSVVRGLVYRIQRRTGPENGK